MRHHSMDLKTTKHLQASSAFQSNKMESPLESNPSFYSKNKEDPFADTFPDPLCKLNLKETSEFVKAFPMANKNNTESEASFIEASAIRKREELGDVVTYRRLEAPSTPGRPVFSFSVGNLSGKSFPSKWDDAEKWLVNSSCNESPAHVIKPPEPTKMSKKDEVFKQKVDVFAEKFQGSVSLDTSNIAFQGVSTLLKDKFTDNVEPLFSDFRYSKPTKQSFLFRNSGCEPLKDAATEVVNGVEHRDIGTEMTPFGSSTTSRCHTPFKSSSPARHNTPANLSGPLTASCNTSIDISEIRDCHFAKLELGNQFDSVLSNWSSREEEEEDISKSLRHFEASDIRKSVDMYRASVWEDEERNKSCLRYQREEAKIQAWVNLQSAKSEAQARKLEVKIQKMRSNLEEKLMKRMAIVHRKAEELRASAQLQHSQQIIKASEQAQKMKNQPNSSYLSGHTTCGCFPCTNNL